MVQKIKDIFNSKVMLQQKINLLENENEILKETIKDELYKEFMKKLSEPEKVERLEKENTRLRKRNRKLKNIIRELMNKRG